LDEASKPKEVDLTLPGWGEWGGSGIKLSSRKRKRFILKPTQEAPRKDRDKRNVIIYEGKDSGLMKHQVSVVLNNYVNIFIFDSKC
jgi:U3 small nucleolar RNA-associated protein 14